MSPMATVSEWIIKITKFIFSLFYEYKSIFAIFNSEMKV